MGNDNDLDKRTADALLVVSPEIIRMISDPNRIRKTLVAKAVSESNVPMAVAVFRMDFESMCRRMISRAGEVLCDIFEDEEINKLCEIAKSSAFASARASGEMISTAVMDVIKSEAEKVGERPPMPSEADLADLKEYIMNSNASGAKRSGLAVGDEVVLGRHEKVSGDDNWCKAMDAFVGKRARIIKMAGFDHNGCEVVKVDVDGADHHWRTQSMAKVA